MCLNLPHVWRGRMRVYPKQGLAADVTNGGLCSTSHTGHRCGRRWFTAKGAILRWTSKFDVLYISLPSLTANIEITVALDQGTVQNDILWLNIWSAQTPQREHKANALLICPTSVAMAHYSCCPLELGVEAPPSKPSRTFRDIGLAGFRRGIWPQEDLVRIGTFWHACIFSLLTWGCEAG